ncbi:fluoride efflux transporter CrcB [Urbifossiella limnaea]|uniref:Fluoride-specific ion channel FluC n=1 Tax=Urbifossiella limnaea TaxID=2528023 RepID=A0A517Y0G4_9BACT|nr:fluoride efflux transporter CrcB [Urbifossiella limnaea]QDU23245.1 Putative fluoride ion transporter CrcB [Urbifossiella limnaea]
MDWLTHPVVLLAVGGGAGANARFYLGRWVAEWQLRHGGVSFPWGTCVINVTGSALLGFLAAACLGSADPGRRAWYLLLGTGFCGGFTTFSTFSVEALDLIREERIGAAVVYVLGSVLAGLGAAALAMRAGR